MGLCAGLFNTHVDWAVENKTYNKNRAHKDLYATLRVEYPTVPSALLQTVRDTAMEAVKATQFKRVPRKKPTSALRYDARTITLRGHQITAKLVLASEYRLCCMSLNIFGRYSRPGNLRVQHLLIPNTKSGKPL